MTLNRTFGHGWGVQRNEHHGPAKFRYQRSAAARFAEHLPKYALVYASAPLAFDSRFGLTAGAGIFFSLNLRQPCVMALLPAAGFERFAMEHERVSWDGFPALHSESDSIWPNSQPLLSGSPDGGGSIAVEKLYGRYKEVRRSNKAVIRGYGQTPADIGAGSATRKSTQVSLVKSSERSSTRKLNERYSVMRFTLTWCGPANNIFPVREGSDRVFVGLLQATGNNPEAEQNMSWYTEYLKSEHWQDVRRRFYQSKLYWGGCHCCGNRNVPLSIHHKSYNRIGREKLNDLIAVCDRCHKEIHGMLKSNPKLKLWTVQRRVRRLKFKRGEYHLPI